MGRPFFLCFQINNWMGGSFSAFSIIILDRQTVIPRFQLNIGLVDRFSTFSIKKEVIINSDMCNFLKTRMVISDDQNHFE